MTMKIIFSWWDFTSNWRINWDGAISQHPKVTACTPNPGQFQLLLGSMLTIILVFGSSYFLLGSWLVLWGRFISYSYLFRNTCHTHDPIAHFWQPTKCQTQTPCHLPSSRQAIQPKSRSFSAYPKPLAGHLIQGLSLWTPIPLPPLWELCFIYPVIYLSVFPAFLGCIAKQRKRVHDIPLLQSRQDLTRTQLDMSWSQRLIALVLDVFF